MKVLLLGFTLFMAAFARADADPGAPFQNLDDLIDQVNIRPYFESDFIPKKKIKIAVFDNGFRFAKKQIGKSLPDYTQIHKAKVPLDSEEEAHGFYMARILWSLLTLGGTDKLFEPAEFHLYYTFGYSNLEAAVNDAIRRKIDIVLYSQTWEYGGNFDGRGFINRLIDKAVDAGVLWINNSGNFAQNTFNSKIEDSADEWIKLPGANDSVVIRCEENKNNKAKDSKCKLRAVLSWNSFSDDVEAGTNKDLDFVLTDDLLNIVQSSGLIQKAEPAEGEPGTSKYPREIITAELKPGKYFLRVKNRSKDFTASDRLRITTSGDFVALENYDSEESVLPPADNPRVVTVGALDSERSSISKTQNKPELWTNSLVSLSKEENFKGTSNSAAMVAAGAAVLMSLDAKLSREDLLRQTGVQAGHTNANVGGGGGDVGVGGADGMVGEGLPLEALGFGPTNPNGCFRHLEFEPEHLPPYLDDFLAQGGVLVETTAGPKMFFVNDPIELTPFQRRNVFNDIIGVGREGAGIFPRTVQHTLPRSFVELVQIPKNLGICGGKPSVNAGGGDQESVDVSTGQIFRMPEPR